MIEHVSYDPLHPEVVIYKATIKRDNNQIIETFFGYVQEDKLPTGTGNANEEARSPDSIR
jgi:hypothetical protein